MQFNQAIEQSNSLVRPIRSILEKIDPASMFPESQPLEIELGCGDSSFLVDCARQCPQHNFIGVERLLGRLRKLDRKGRRLGLSNLLGLRIESSYFLEYLLPEHCAWAIHVYFPDPWPKRRHWKYRLITPRFASVAARALVPGGMIFLRTDDVEYFGQMLQVFEADKSFQTSTTPAGLSQMLTDFEKEFLAEGIKTNRAAFERIPQA